MKSIVFAWMLRTGHAPSIDALRSPGYALDVGTLVLSPPRKKRRVAPSPSEPSESNTDPANWAADLALVRAALRGDAQAREELSTRLQILGRVLHVINAQHGGALDSDELTDVAQDVALIVWRKLDTFQAISSLETWAYGIASLEFMNALRRKLRAPVPIGDLLSDDPIDESAPNGPEAFADACDALEALGGLAPEERRIVERRAVRDEEFEQIAATERLSIPAVKARYYRALERLRSKFSSGRASPGRGGVE